MPKLFVLATALFALCTPGLAVAADVTVQTHRRAVVVTGDAVAVVARPQANVVIVTGPADHCTTRTVRTWVNGHYFKRRVTHCID